MRTIGAMAAVVLACGLLAGAGEDKRVEVPAKEIGGKFVIVGDLGKPLGTFMTIGGVGGKPMMMDGAPFLADALDGQKLHGTILIGVRRGAEIKEGGRYVLRGYEDGGMISSPVEAGSTDIPQTNYHFSTWFVVTAVKEQPAPAPAAIKQNRP